MDAAIKIATVKDVVGFDPLSLLPSRKKAVTFMVGDHGPFTEIFDFNDFTEQAINARLDAVARTLRATGAVA